MKASKSKLPPVLQTRVNIKSFNHLQQQSSTSIQKQAKIMAKIERIKQILDILQTNEKIHNTQNGIQQKICNKNKENIPTSKSHRPIITPLNLSSLQTSKFNSLTKQGQQHFIKKTSSQSQGNKYTMSMTQQQTSGVSQNQYNYNKYLFSQSQEDYDNSVQSSLFKEKEFNKYR